MKSHETAYVWNVRVTPLHIAILTMKEICQKCDLTKPPTYVYGM